MRKLTKLIFPAILAATIALVTIGSAGAQSSADSMSAKASKAVAAMKEKLDINSATKDQLDGIPLRAVSRQSIAHEHDGQWSIVISHW